MKVPLQITFRDVPPSEAVAERIRKGVGELERINERIISCHVLVSSPHRHHRNGRLFHVRVDLGLPGKEISVNATAHDAHEHEDVYVAVRDAFDAAKRRLEDFTHRRRLRAALNPRLA
jgi:ribosome-associated translation inhibitor RaiA